ncbi:MAG: TolC family protein [Cyanobacteria bacterium REEB67]|nr:TolC family protein [Cyanobacteria bacterium REEB67]
MRTLSKVLPIILLFATGTVVAARAESSALGGLGEPASPDSLARPDKLFPASPGDASLSDPPAIKTAPLPAARIPKVGGKGGGRVGARAGGKENPDGDGAVSVGGPIRLHQSIEKGPLDGHGLTLREAVEYSQRNYPTILKGEAQVNASKAAVKVQKLNEYLPDTLFQFQEIMASHNKLNEIFFGSPVFPGITGPAMNNVNFEPMFSSGAGVSLDWAPIDFGLHKARINMSKSLYKQSQLQYKTTHLDVGLATASAFLDAVVAVEQMKAAEQNMRSFKSFSEVVHAQVGSQLKPGADASLADAQYANAANDLIRARLARDIAMANLSDDLGLGGQTVAINLAGIVETSEPADIQQAPPLYEDVPILQTAAAALDVQKAQKKILDKEYYPVFHFLGGVNTRGAGLSNLNGRPTSAQGSGTLPVVPNYQAALIVNWNFLDIYRIRAQKKVQMQRIKEQEQEYNLILQRLRTQDVQSRSRVAAALSLAQNMPIQTESARVAVRQSEARYKTGLGSVAQVAEANQTLANSRVQEAIARVGVWRALLAVASVHGDLKPFLLEIDRVQKGL